MIKSLNNVVDLSVFKAFDAIELNSFIRINRFYILVKERNQGLGSREMKKITDYAERVGKDIVLYATSSKNKRFYRRHGFQNSSNDYIFSCNMRRKYESLSSSEKGCEHTKLS